MLEQLRIRNLAIIDDISIDFTGGFSALTGETGAGKSIVVGALNLVLGERASSEDVRSGCDAAEVEAVFDLEDAPEPRGLLEEMGLSDPDDACALLLRRQVLAGGRSRCYVNGRSTTLAQLRELGNLLVDLHGQHQHQSLLRVELHREILDRYAGGSLGEALGVYRRLYDRYGGLLAERERLSRDSRELARRRDVLEFQLGEIREAGLEAGEEESLGEERSRLENVEALGVATGGAYGLLYEAPGEEATAEDLLRQALDFLSQAEGLDGSLGGLRERLENARAEVADVAEELRDYVGGLEQDPARLEVVQERLALIRRLERKYGASVEEVLAAAEGFERELEGLCDSDTRRGEIDGELEGLRPELVAAAQALTELRSRAAEKFSAGLRRQLGDLEMPRVQFEVCMEQTEKEAGVEEGEGEVEATEREEGLTLAFPDGRKRRLYSWGLEQVEFLISPNPGEALKPLRRIASGGELSRVMLALKILMRDQNPVRTVVFDEIDAGISGKTGLRIGEKMQQLGEELQLLCITHLPQIAARATRHYAVDKQRREGRTRTRVRLLEGEERAVELARLLGGEADSEIARRHAEELLAGVTARKR